LIHYLGPDRAEKIADELREPEEGDGPSWSTVSKRLDTYTPSKRQEDMSFIQGFFATWNFLWKMSTDRNLLLSNKSQDKRFLGLLDFVLGTKFEEIPGEFLHDGCREATNNILSALYSKEFHHWIRESTEDETKDTNDEQQFLKNALSKDVYDELIKSVKDKVQNQHLDELKYNVDVDPRTGQMEKTRLLNKCLIFWRQKIGKKKNSIAFICLIQQRF